MVLECCLFAKWVCNGFVCSFRSFHLPRSRKLRWANLHNSFRRVSSGSFRHPNFSFLSRLVVVEEANPHLKTSTQHDRVHLNKFFLTSSAGFLTHLTGKVRANFSKKFVQKKGVAFWYFCILGGFLGLYKETTLFVFFGGFS